MKFLIGKILSICFVFYLLIFISITEGDKVFAKDFDFKLYIIEGRNQSELVVDTYNFSNYKIEGIKFVDLNSLDEIKASFVDDKIFIYEKMKINREYKFQINLKDVRSGERVLYESKFKYLQGKINVSNIGINFCDIGVTYNKKNLVFIDDITIYGKISENKNDKYDFMFRKNSFEIENYRDKVEFNDISLRSGTNYDIYCSVRVNNNVSIVTQKKIRTQRFKISEFKSNMISDKKIKLSWDISNKNLKFLDNDSLKIFVKNSGEWNYSQIPNLKIKNSNVYSAIIDMNKVHSKYEIKLVYDLGGEDLISTIEQRNDFHNLTSKVTVNGIRNLNLSFSFDNKFKFKDDEVLNIYLIDKSNFNLPDKKIFSEKISSINFKPEHKIQFNDLKTDREYKILYEIAYKDGSSLKIKEDNFKTLKFGIKKLNLSSGMDSKKIFKVNLNWAINDSKFKFLDGDSLAVYIKEKGESSYSNEPKFYKSEGLDSTFSLNFDVDGDKERYYDLKFVYNIGGDEYTEFREFYFNNKPLMKMKSKTEQNSTEKKGFYVNVRDSRVNEVVLECLYAKDFNFTNGDELQIYTIIEGDSSAKESLHSKYTHSNKMDLRKMKLIKVSSLKPGKKYKFKAVVKTKNTIDDTKEVDESVPDNIIDYEGDAPEYKPDETPKPPSVENGSGSETPPPQKPETGEGDGEDSSGDGGSSDGGSTSPEPPKEENDSSPNPPVGGETPDPPPSNGDSSDKEEGEEGEDKEEDGEGDDDDGKEDNDNDNDKNDGEDSDDKVDEDKGNGDNTEEVEPEDKDDEEGSDTSGSDTPSEPAEDQTKKIKKDSSSQLNEKQKEVTSETKKFEIKSFNVKESRTNSALFEWSVEPNIITVNEGDKVQIFVKRKITNGYPSGASFEIEGNEIKKNFSGEAIVKYMNTEYDAKIVYTISGVKYEKTVNFKTTDGKTSCKVRDITETSAVLDIVYPKDYKFVEGDSIEIYMKEEGQKSYGTPFFNLFHGGNLVLQDVKTFNLTYLKPKMVYDILVKFVNKSGANDIPDAHTQFLTSSLLLNNCRIDSMNGDKLRVKTDVKNDMDVFKKMEIYLDVFYKAPDKTNYSGKAIFSTNKELLDFEFDLPDKTKDYDFLISYNPHGYFNETHFIEFELEYRTVRAVVDESVKETEKGNQKSYDLKWAYPNPINFESGDKINIYLRELPDEEEKNDKPSSTDKKNNDDGEKDIVGGYVKIHTIDAENDSTSSFNLDYFINDYKKYEILIEIVSNKFKAGVGKLEFKVGKILEEIQKEEEINYDIPINVDEYTGIGDKFVFKVPNLEKINLTEETSLVCDIEGIKATFDGEGISVKGLVPGKEYSMIEVKAQVKEDKELVFNIENIKLDPEDSSQKFLYDVYMRSFLRDPDEVGYKYWIDRLVEKNISARDFLINLLFAEKEFSEMEYSTDKFISVLYSIIVDRDPDKDGLAFWINFYNKEAIVNSNNDVFAAKKYIVDRMINEKEFEKLVLNLGFEY